MFRAKEASLILVLSIIFMLIAGCNGVDVRANPEEAVEGKTIQGHNAIEAEGTKHLSKKEKDKSMNLEKGVLKAYFIDVGQGNATFIVGPNGETMLHDAGGDGDVGRIIVDYIRNLGHEKIDVAVFTHPYADHISGAPTIFRELQVGAVYYPKVMHTTRTFQNFVEAVKEAGLKFKMAKAGVEIPFGDVDAVLAAPISDTYDNLNDYSAVVRLAWGNTSLLLTGDIEKTSEEELIMSNENLDVDLLLIPHHGSNSSSTQKFLDRTMPSYGIISAGAENRYGHPHREVLECLEENNIIFYNTAEYGNIVATLDGEKVTISLENGTCSEGKVVEDKQDFSQEVNTKGIIHEKIEDKIQSLTVTASIDNTAPTHNTTITATVKVTSQGEPVSDTEVKLLNHFKSTTTPYEGVTNKHGIAEISYSIGRASIGYEVKVEVVAKKDNIEATVSTSFTPQ
ncbi:MAG: MBL fold metallo-hydrolase [Clostridiaceae bacterium]|nr:MBL fold metallo-hydrolase [Clostridiaceae bacterium]